MPSCPAGRASMMTRVRRLLTGATILSAGLCCRNISAEGTDGKNDFSDPYHSLSVTDSNQPQSRPQFAMPYRAGASQTDTGLLQVMNMGYSPEGPHLLQFTENGQIHFETKIKGKLDEIARVDVQKDGPEEIYLH